MTTPRIVTLLLTGCVIAGLCVYRATRPPRPVRAVAQTQFAYPPRGWELPYKRPESDATTLMKFDRYLGRQPLVVVFTGDADPGATPALIWLRDNYDRVREAGYAVVGVTPTLPSAVEAAAKQSRRLWPFPVVSDIVLRDSTPVPVHRAWGLAASMPEGGASSDADDGPPDPVRPAVFLIDRRGYVEYENGAPRPLGDPLREFEKLFPE